jgi:two-component system sensor histidine kinase ChiS
VDVKLGDQIQREMTVMFSDIRAFTTLSELMSPKETFDFINEYLERVSPVIRNHNGFIDKYIGDAIMALFPESVDDALETAIAMQLQVVLYNQQRAERGQAPIQIGVGLHLGKLMLGTVGEMKRMEGTVISDAVNLASRLEGLTKMFGAAIIISADALSRATGKYETRALGIIQVKGKKEFTGVVEVIEGLDAAAAELKVKTRDDFEKGLLHYQAGDFKKAAVAMSKVLRLNIDDKAARRYLKKAKYYMEHPVADGWSGVEAMDSK